MIVKNEIFLQKKRSDQGSAVLTFIGYKRTNKQTDKKSIYIYRLPSNVTACAVTISPFLNTPSRPVLNNIRNK